MRPVLIALLLAGAATASAQMDNQLFRSWAWRPEPGSARFEGLAGTFVAVADDPMASVANPAGLAQVDKVALSASLMRGPSRLSRDEGTEALQYWSDERQSRVGLGFVGGAFRLSPRWTAGGYIRESQAIDLRLLESGPGWGYDFDTGTLRTRVTDLGGAAAFQVSERLSLGARVGISRLVLESDSSRLRVRPGMAYDPPPEDARVQSTVAPGGAIRLTASAGLLAWLSGTVRLGMLVETGAAHACQQQVARPGSGSDSEAITFYDVQRPARLSAGLAWQAFPRMLLTTQVDYVRYRDTLLEEDVASSVRRDGIEPHAGVELSYPQKERIVQLRAGIHVRATGDPAVHYGGPEWHEPEGWVHAPSRVGVSAGASLLLRRLRIDLATSRGWRSGGFLSVTLRR